MTDSYCQQPTARPLPATRSAATKARRTIMLACRCRLCTYALAGPPLTFAEQAERVGRPFPPLNEGAKPAPRRVRK